MRDLRILIWCLSLGIQPVPCRGVSEVNIMPVFNSPTRAVPLKPGTLRGSKVKPTNYCWPSQSFVPARRRAQLAGRGKPEEGSAALVVVQGLLNIFPLVKSPEQ